MDGLDDRGPEGRRRPGQLYDADGGEALFLQLRAAAGAMPPRNTSEETTTG